MPRPLYTLDSLVTGLETGNICLYQRCQNEELDMFVPNEELTSAATTLLRDIQNKQ